MHMTRTLMAIGLTALLGSSALAHEEHCHLKSADGKLADAPDVKDKKSCQAKGGVWEHHHEHCHKMSAEGKATDYPAAKTEKACSAAGGKWSDHGHDAATP